MTLPNLDPSRKPDALFDDLCAYVRAADALVEQRETVDLAGMDSAIRALCDGILKLPVAEANAYNAKLTELMQAIEAMQAKMVALQQEISTTLKSLSNQKKAARAYINAPTAKKEE